MLTRLRTRTARTTAAIGATVVLGFGAAACQGDDGGGVIEENGGVVEDDGGVVEENGETEGTETES